jgi:hypothetical protein
MIRLDPWTFRANQSSLTFTKKKNMLSSSRFRFLVLLICSCLAASCTQLAASLIEISKLQQAIVKEYGEQGVNVRLNNSTILIITFINSPLNIRSVGERAQRAEQTAQFVKQHYSSIAAIDEIWVGFVAQKTSFVIVTYTEGLGSFGFDKNAHQLPSTNDLPVVDSPDSYPAVVYSPALKQTDVSIMRLQLEGDLNNGLAMAPHFTVPGDATGLRRSPVIPETVGLDFASYSTSVRFPGETKLIVSSDNRVVYETTSQFSASRMTNGTFSEFLLLKIPYQAFRRMATGEKVTVTLGDKQYELSDDQRAGLREMTRYVKE